MRMGREGKESEIEARDFEYRYEEVWKIEGTGMLEERRL
jgi:hypothetical protein